MSYNSEYNQTSLLGFLRQHRGVLILNVNISHGVNKKVHMFIVKLLFKVANYIVADICKG